MHNDGKSRLDQLRPHPVDQEHGVSRLKYAGATKTPTFFDSGEETYLKHTSPGVMNTQRERLSVDTFRIPCIRSNSKTLHAQNTVFVMPRNKKRSAAPTLKDRIRPTTTLGSTFITSQAKPEVWALFGCPPASIPPTPLPSQLRRGASVCQILQASAFDLYKHRPRCPLKVSQTTVCDKERNQRRPGVSEIDMTATDAAVAFEFQSKPFQSFFCQELHKKKKTDIFVGVVVLFAVNPADPLSFQQVWYPSAEAGILMKNDWNTGETIPS